MELQNLKELEKIVKFCRKQGILTLKHAGFEIALSPSALFPPKPTKADPNSDQIKVEDQFSAEDALYWSSAGIPDSGAQ